MEVGLVQTVPVLIDTEMQHDMKVFDSGWSLNDLPV